MAVNTAFDIIPNQRWFLSCLYGSEHIDKACSRCGHFLSCLYGSEHEVRAKIYRALFLSCLYGSERCACAW